MITLAFEDGQPVWPTLVVLTITNTQLELPRLVPHGEGGLSSEGMCQHRFLEQVIVENHVVRSPDQLTVYLDFSSKESLYVRSLVVLLGGKLYNQIVRARESNSPLRLARVKFTKREESQIYQRIRDDLRTKHTLRRTKSMGELALQHN